MTAAGNRPWTDEELREGFSLSVGDDRFNRFLREVCEWWERQPRTALRTIPRAARRLDVPVPHMREVLQASGTKLGHDLKTLDYCRQHGPMREATLRDDLRTHCKGCAVRTAATLELRDAYRTGDSIPTLSIVNGIAEQTVRNALREAEKHEPERPGEK
nr:hypothetical protein GCM10017745_03230 [Saccharothrix mutabilis subsp. capreolus]